MYYFTHMCLIYNLKGTKITFFLKVFIILKFLKTLYTYSISLSLSNLLNGLMKCAVYYLTSKV